MGDPEIMVTLTKCNVQYFWPEGDPATMIRYVFEAQFTDGKAQYGATGYGPSVEGAIAALWVDYRLIRRQEEDSG